MLRTDLPDHRRATEDQLLAALRDRDPLALAEVYHRTIPAAHAAARRLLSGSAEVEALLREVYAELWAAPPTDTSLEAWVRGRCFALAADDLRERDAAPASPSLTALLPELPRPEVRYLDAAERALADLDDSPRKALLAAHDKGVPSHEQTVPDAGSALIAALLALAGPEPGNETVDATACTDIPELGDWVLGLLPPDDAARVAERVNARAECATLAKTLRRGRRRLEGLPPTPDMGQRVLVVVLAGGPPPAIRATVAAPAAAGAGGLPSALDDTGDLTPSAADLQARQAAAAGDDGETSQRRDPYAELSALDEVDDDDHAVDFGEDAAGGEEAADDGYADEDLPYAPLPPKRSRGARVLVWVLGALFLIAGVAAGLYLGLTLLS